jgi:hypothetical protein
VKCIKLNFRTSLFGIQKATRVLKKAMWDNQLQALFQALINHLNLPTTMRLMIGSIA